MASSRKTLTWNPGSAPDIDFNMYIINKGNNKFTELRTILQREGQNS
jgi:hypothetical protein